MISSLSGKITEIGENYLVLNINGIGYRVYMADKALNSLAKNAGQINLYTKQLFDQHGKTFELFGFLKREDLVFFELLISVSGVGPKKALNAMSLIEFDELMTAVVKDDHSYLNKISGLGPKTAQKVIFGLRDKIKKAEVLKYSKIDLSGEAEAIDALVSLGYPQNDAMAALRKVSKKARGVEEKVKEALKTLSGK